MMIYITSINFNYDDYESGFNSVTFNFTSAGATYSVSGSITVSKAEYMGNSGDINSLRQLVKDKIAGDLQGE